MGNDKKSNAKNTDLKETKIVTKYDKKMQKKREEELRDKRRKKITKITLSVIGVLLVIAIGAFGWMKYDTVKNEYISVDGSKVNLPQYEYYYNTTVDDFVTSYSYVLASMGIDTSKDFSDTEYSNGLTWGDYFDEMTVEQIKQCKALVKEASEKNFEYDVTEDYNEYYNTLTEEAASKNVSIGKHYKNSFGTYATVNSVKSAIEEYLTATAYYEKLTEDMAATDSEITAKYNEDKSAYDYFDFRVFSFDEADFVGQSVTAKNKADEMLQKIEDESSFAALCKEYAQSDEKEKYNDESTSLMSKTRFSSIDSVLREWLSDASRKAGEKTVIEDSDNGTSFVVYFVNRYFDDEMKTEIGQTVLSTKMQEYIGNLTNNINIKDKYNNLKYLKAN